jgi:hypothetical protein
MFLIYLLIFEKSIILIIVISKEAGLKIILENRNDVFYYHCQQERKVSNFELSKSI